METRDETCKIDQIRIAIGNMRKVKDHSALMAHTYVSRCASLEVHSQLSFFDQTTIFKTDTVFDHGRPAEGVRLYLEKTLSTAANAISLDPSVKLEPEPRTGGSWDRAMAVLKDRMLLDKPYQPYAMLYPIMFLTRMADAHSPELWKLLNIPTEENCQTFADLAQTVDVMWVLEHVMLVNPKVFASFTYNQNWLYSTLLFAPFQNASIHALHKTQADFKAAFSDDGIEGIEKTRILRGAQNILACFHFLDLFYAALKTYEKI